MYDITYNYDIPFSDIIYYITYDGCMSLPSPPPGLHSGLDSFRYSTIAYETSFSTAGCNLLLTQCLSIAESFQKRGCSLLCCPVRSGARSAWLRIRVGTLY